MTKAKDLENKVLTETAAGQPDAALAKGDDAEKQQAGAVDALQGQLAEADRATADHAQTIDDLTAQLGDRNAQVETLTGQIASLTKSVGERDGMIEAMRSEVTAARQANEHLVIERDTLAGAVEKAAVVQRTLATRVLRPVGRKQFSDTLRIDLAAKLAGRVEIAFSNGSSEIAGLDPVIVQGFDQWEKRGPGYVLRKHVTVGGPAVGDGPYEVAGFGLLDTDGNEIAWCELPNVVAVPAGGQVQFRDTIIF